MVCVQGDHRLGATPGFFLETAPVDGVWAFDFHDLDGLGGPGPCGHRASPFLEGID